MEPIYSIINSLLKGQLEDIIDECIITPNEGRFICIAGRPAMGKSALMLSIALNLLEKNIPTAIFSLEMSNIQILRRLISSYCNIEWEKDETEIVSKGKEDQINDFIKEMYKFPLFIDETPSPTVDEIKNKILKLKVEQNIKVVFIDYLQLIKEKEKSHARQEETMLKLEELRNLSYEINLPIIVLFQISRLVQNELYEEIDYRNSLTREIMKPSGISPDLFDIIMYIHRPAFYTKDYDSEGMSKNEEPIYLFIDNNQTGNRDEKKLVFNRDNTSVY